MTEKKIDLSGLDDLAGLIENIEKKYTFKSMSITLSEEEWFTLDQVSIITGLTKTMIFRMALHQLLRDIITRKQKTKKVGEKTFSYKKPDKENLNKRKKRYCSSNMPSSMHNAISIYAKKNNLKSYEVYSQIIDEFLEFVENSEKPPSYQECPKDSLKRSIALFEETMQGMKALKQRDRVTDYRLMYTAAMRFIEKNNLLIQAA